MRVIPTGIVINPLLREDLSNQKQGKSKENVKISSPSRAHVSRCISIVIKLYQFTSDKDLALWLYASEDSPYFLLITCIGNEVIVKQLTTNGYFPSAWLLQDRRISKQFPITDKPFIYQHIFAAFRWTFYWFIHSGNYNHRGIGSRDTDSFQCALLSSWSKFKKKQCLLWRTVLVTFGKILMKTILSVRKKLYVLNIWSSAVIADSCPIKVKGKMMGFKTDS